MLQESISGVRVVKSFAREDYEIERFQNQNNLNFKANMKSVQLSSLLTPTVEFLAAVIVAVIFMVWRLSSCKWSFNCWGISCVFNICGKFGQSCKTH